MDATTNLPEPTYGFKSFFMSVKNTINLMKNVIRLAKRLLML